MAMTCLDIKWKHMLTIEPPGIVAVLLIKHKCLWSIWGNDLFAATY